MVVIIFISHRSTDKEIADILLGFLVRAGIPREVIFCSSLPGNDVVEKISDEVKSAMKNSLVNVAILSQDYYQSAYCLNEAGVMWYLDNTPIIPIALPEVNPKNMIGFLNSDYKLRRLDNDDDIAFIYDTIREVISVPQLKMGIVTYETKKLKEQYQRFLENKYYAKHSSHPIQTEVGNGTSNVLFEKTSMSKLIWGYAEQEKLSPIEPGMIIMIGGHTGSCKSLYTHHVINANIKSGARVAYCCLKDNPNDVLNSVLSAASQIDRMALKDGLAMTDEWLRLAECASETENGDLKLLTYEDLHNSGDDVISLIENSNANIVVVDDFNGLCLKDDEVERFIYSLKRAAIKSNTVIFVIYNMSVKNRMDLRPMLCDFPSEDYYRIYDIVHLLFRPALYARYYMEDKHALEVIVAKGRCCGTIQMEVHEDKSQISSTDTKVTY